MRPRPQPPFATAARAAARVGSSSGPGSDSQLALLISIFLDLVSARGVFGMTIESTPLWNLASIALLFLLSLLLLLTLDREHAFGELHLDVLLVDTWQLGMSLDRVLSFSFMSILRPAAATPKLTSPVPLPMASNNRSISRRIVVKGSSPTTSLRSKGINDLKSTVVSHLLTRAPPGIGLAAASLSGAREGCSH